MARPFPYTSILRRWPRLRRRVVITRRSYDKVYWYLYDFKEEFLDEMVRAPRELKKSSGKLDPTDEYPMYYKAYLWITCIPAGFMAYLRSFKEDWDKWVEFRDSTFSGYKRISSEVRETYHQAQPRNKEIFLIALRMFRDAIKGFLKGYQESMSEKPFPSDEIIHKEQNQSDQSSNSVRERDDEEQKLK